MVVQHNMQAMNANRQLNIVTGAQGKSTEKLSSGYKINRAADDAAGLSISEKMRRQIRGLDRASTNAQDGISSVQTAEGALNEVHDMLQRMNELANQAANGTNSANDRQSIQDEISQLNTEIDRVAETTKFNETYLLKGDVGTKEITLKAHDAGIKGSLSDQGDTAQFQVKLESDSDISISSHNYHIYGEGDDVASMQEKVEDADKVIINGTTYNRATDTKTTGGETVEQLSAKIDAASKKTSKLSGSLAGLQTSLATLKASVTTKQASADARKQICVGGKEACVSLKKTCIDIKKASIAAKEASVSQKEACVADWKSMCVDPKQEKVDEKQSTINNKEEQLSAAQAQLEEAQAMLNDDDESNDDTAAATISTVGEQITTLAGSLAILKTSLATLKASVDTKAASVEARKQVSVGTLQASVEAKKTSVSIKEASVSAKEASVAQKRVCVEDFKKASVDSKQKKVDEKQAKIDFKQNSLEEAQAELADATKKLDALTKGETLPVSKTATFISDDKEYTLNDLKGMIKDGTKVGFGDEKARTAVDLSTNKNNITVDEAKTKIKDALLQANQIGADDESAVKVSDAKKAGEDTFEFDITKGKVTVAKEKSFELQVGSDADLTNKITVNIETMNSKYLGVQNLNVVDDSGIAATYALDAVEDALSKVSEQRSALGAVQNRLEHTINNLDNVVENTQSAESQIRDTDIADEMVRYSKNNILSQAGQSMLAQANQSTQGALSLLG